MWLDDAALTEQESAAVAQAGAVLADDMGLGKTLTIIAFHLHRSAGPTIVVCPASLLTNWEREIARFAPGVPVRRHHGAARDLNGLPAGGIVLTSYGTLLRDVDEFRGISFGLVVADEAQNIKNPRSMQSAALHHLDAGLRIAVTGTPVENGLTDLWAVLDWTNPGLFGTAKAFRTAPDLNRLVGPATCPWRISWLVTFAPGARPPTSCTAGSRPQGARRSWTGSSPARASASL